MKLLSALLLIAISVGASLLAVRLVPSATAPAGQEHEASYAHVMQTQTLRCGYGTWQPRVYKDPVTGRMSGLFVELIEAMGRLNGLKIDWTGETDWGQIPEAIAPGKIDAFCSGMADDAMRGKRLAFTHPLSYWTFNVVVRADDTRFPAGSTIAANDLNKLDYATAYTEGDVLETIAKTEFPNVKGVPLPPLGTPADNMMYVATHKTDFVVFPKVLGADVAKSGLFRIDTKI